MSKPERQFTGLRIRAIRRARRMTQARLAQAAGVSASYLNLIEANKRPVAGRLLDRIAEALHVERGELNGDAERQLVENLNEIVADPAVGLTARPPAGTEAMVGRHGDWASAILQLYRAFNGQRQTVTALADRLNRDPFLGESIHRVLTHVTSIRSASEILDGTSAIGEKDRERFQSIIASDSRNLSEAAAGLAAFFDNAKTRVESATPTEQVDAFIYESANCFPSLEDAASDFLNQLSPGQDIVDHCEAVLGADMPYLSTFRGQTTLEAWRFSVVRAVVARTFSSAIASVVEHHPALLAAQARAMATKALESYTAAALLMPYDAFHEAAVTNRYDIDLLSLRFRVSYEQAAHRLATLRRPGQEGVRLAFMRSDPSGYVDKRLPLPKLPLPRYGSACPIWPVYTAFQMPGMTSRAFGSLPDGETFLFFARAVDKAPAVSGRPRRLVSIMLACDGEDAARLVYGDGLDPNSGRYAVGTVCRLCARATCDFRQEQPLSSNAQA